MAAAELDLCFDAALFGKAQDVFVERSVKLTPETVQTDRLLMGADRAQLSRAQVLELGVASGLDQTARDELDLRLGEAFMIHAGREGRGPDATRKLYLEFGTPPADLPDLRFLAWKTRAGGSCLRSCYVRRALNDRTDAICVLDDIGAEGSLRTALLDLVDLAGAQTALKELTLLLVEEAGTDRKSLDLNIYDAELTMSEIMPSLAPALSELGFSTIPGFDGCARAGHVSAGTGRDGQTFLTVYGDARLMRGEA